MKIYNSYSFVDKDPVIDELRTVIQDEGASFTFIENSSGVSGQTIRNWFDGKTKRPQNASIEAVVRCLGYERRIKKPTGKKAAAPQPAEPAVQMITQPGGAPRKRWPPRKRRMA